jgi:hypothetical protein
VQHNFLQACFQFYGALWSRSLFVENTYSLHFFVWPDLPVEHFFSSSLLPHTWELAPISEHRANFTQFLNQDGR